MNSKTTVIIADDSVEFLNLLAGQLEEDPRVQVIGRPATAKSWSLWCSSSIPMW